MANLFGVQSLLANPSLGRPAPTGAPSTDPAALEVERLLAGLEGFEKPVDPTPGPFRSAIGGLGDAILAAATVKAGGVPGVGPFRSGQRALQQDFRARSAQADAANRDLRNRIRIGDFEERRRLKGAKALKVEDRKTRVAVEVQKGIVAEARRVEDAANAFRHSLRQKILDRNIQTDVNLLEADETQLKEILDGQDPTAAFEAFMESLPDDMEVGEVSKNANGTFSFRAKSKTAASKELPAGVISALIKEGVDPAPFIKDPKLAAAARTAAQSNSKKILENEADQFMTDLRKFAGDNQVGPDGSIDAVNAATMVMADDLIKMRGANASQATVKEYYEGEVSIAAAMVEAGEWSEAQALDYITRLRQAMTVSFPGVSLDLVPKPEPALLPQPEAEDAGAVPAAAGEPSPTLTGLGRAVEGVKTGLGRAASGIARTLATPRPADGGGGAG